MSPKASDIVPDKNISFLFKGPPGFGKTIAACSAAIYGDVWLGYFDKKIPVEVLTFFKKFRPDLLERITYESYGSHNAHEYLNKLNSFTRDCRYVALITDSVTSLTSAAVNWSMAFRDVNKGPKMDKLNKAAPQMIPDWDEYKVETSLVTQALDICKTLPVMNIWTAHPLPSMKVEGAGTKVDSITKVQSIVSYGSKVGALIPGGFNEIYHFGRQSNKRVVWTDMIGDDYAKTSMNLPTNIDITDKLFFEVWKELVDLGYVTGEEGKIKDANVNPFATNSNVIGSDKWK